MCISDFAAQYTIRSKIAVCGFRICAKPPSPIQNRHLHRDLGPRERARNSLMISSAVFWHTRIYYCLCTSIMKHIYMFVDRKTKRRARAEERPKVLNYRYKLCAADNRARGPQNDLTSNHFCCVPKPLNQ